VYYEIVREREIFYRSVIIEFIYGPNKKGLRSIRPEAPCFRFQHLGVTRVSSWLTRWGLERQ